MENENASDCGTEVTTISITPVTYLSLGVLTFGSLGRAQPTQPIASQIGNCLRQDV